MIPYTSFMIPDKGFKYEFYDTIYENNLESSFLFLPLQKRKHFKDTRNMTDDNKMILQSYKLTTIRDDFGIYAQRLIVRIAEAMQYRFEEADFLTKELKPSDERLKWKFQLADLQAEGEKHHTHVKEELQRVIKASVHIDTANGWRESVVFTDIEFDNSGTIEVKINDSVWHLFVEISKGFKRYQLATAMALKSTYALRLYQLLNENSQPITYKIDWLKQLFQLQDKYTNTNDFIRFVIEPARKELDKKSEMSFTYIANLATEGKGRRPIESLTFYTHKTSNSPDAELQRREIQRKYGIGQLPQWLIAKLMQGYDFTMVEIQNNAGLFCKAEETMKNPTLLEFLDTKRAKAMQAKNPKGWIISAIVGKLFENDSQTWKQ